MVFILNGNAFSEAGPSSLTADAASVIQAAGHRAIQLSYPMIATPGAYHGLARSIRSLSRGRPIGLVGFSAGGTLAVRLSAIKSLNVSAVLDLYGPPDLGDWFQSHRGDLYSQYVRAHVPFRKSLIDLLSGPSDSKAHIVAAFGLGDRNVTASNSIRSFHREFSVGRIYTYAGGHGAPITASRPALEDFLQHLHA